MTTEEQLPDDPLTLYRKNRPTCPKCGFMTLVEYTPGCTMAWCGDKKCDFTEAVPDFYPEGLWKKINQLKK